MVTYVGVMNACKNGCVLPSVITQVLGPALLLVNFQSGAKAVVLAVVVLFAAVAPVKLAWVSIEPSNAIGVPPWLVVISTAPLAIPAPPGFATLVTQ